MTTTATVTSNDLIIKSSHLFSRVCWGIQQMRTPQARPERVRELTMWKGGYKNQWPALKGAGTFNSNVYMVVTRFFLKFLKNFSAKTRKNNSNYNLRAKYKLTFKKIIGHCQARWCLSYLEGWGRRILSFRPVWEIYCVTIKNIKRTSGHVTR